MVDESYLDNKYFIDDGVYNCPFCNRNSVVYEIQEQVRFDWSESKQCFALFVRCASCKNKSMHMSFKNLAEFVNAGGRHFWKINSEIEDIDSEIFYSVPTSFFVLDEKIPKEIRELVSEAEGCLKMNFLTGASSCTRKAIYELLIKENASGDYYEERIKSLKAKYPNSDADLFDILCRIQEMTSDKVHEQSWEEWDSSSIRLIIETLKTILHDIYVLPKIKEERSKYIKDLSEKVKSKKK